jgi:protein-disulfide isomerase
MMASAIPFCELEAPMPNGCRKLAVSLAAALTICAGAAAAQEAAADPALEQAIRDYILAHPEVIAEALQKYQAQQEEAKAAAQQQALKELQTRLSDHPSSPVLGNPAGNVTVVEFLDYRCPYCKAMHQAMTEMVAADGNIRLVVKEFPILGEDSLFASRAALAAARQGKYREMHDALMTFKGKLAAKDVEAMAQGIGLDLDKLKQDMAAPEIDEELRHNYSLAESLGINGTPAFVIGEKLIPGAVKVEEIKARVDAVRQGAS